MKRDQKRTTQQVSLDLLKKIKELYPGLAFGEGLNSYIEFLEEKVKAGEAAGSPILSESGGQGSPPSPAVGGEAVSPESKRYDWTQVPECPLRDEARNLCIWKAPRKKAIIEEVEPEICKRCEFVLKLNEKIKQIELEAIEKRAQIERDRLERERLKAKEEEEKTRRKQMTHERGPPTVYFPDGEVWR